MHRHGWTLNLARGIIVSTWLGAVGSAHALGLGKLTVYSGLDEALNADIELTTTSADELKKLTAGLAPRSEFDAAGIERSTQLNDIKYTVSRRSDGRSVLKLSSDQPMREPFLHFLLQVDWAGGRMMREYTALLDPPQIVAARQSAVNAPVAESARTAAPVPAPAPFEKQPETVAPTPNAPAAPVGDAAPAPKAADANESVDIMPATPAEISPTAPTGETGSRAAKQNEDDLLGPGGRDSAQAPVPSTAVTTSPTTSNARKAPATSAAPNMATSNNGSEGVNEYGPIKRGETLSQITKQLKLADGVSAEQAMLALLKSNKSAFFGNNVNNLKAGKVLTIPSRSEIETTPRTVAVKEFRAQYTAWQEYKLKLASAAQVVKVPSESNVVTGDLNAVPKGAGKNDTQKTDAGKPADAKTATTDATAKAKGDKDLLKIVRGNTADAKNAKDGKSAGGDTAERQRLADRAATLEEAITSKELENKELRERVSQLEAQVKNAKRLIELENKDLAKAQQQATKPGDKTVDKKDTKETAKAAPVPEKPKTTSNTPATVAAPTVGKETAAPVTSDAGKDTKPSKAQAPAVAAKAPPAASAPAPAEETSFFADILKNLTDSSLMLPIVGGIAALGFGGALLYYRRRRQAIAEFGESILAGGGLNANSEGAANPDAAAGDVSFLSDFSQGGMGNIHTDEVDPIAEAEVYLAYGRDEQAEEILKEAVVKDPNRHELRLKLLEIYHQRNDLPSFETVAEELYAALEGKAGKVWEKAEEMGRKMNPDNPLFRGAAAAAVGAAAVAMSHAEPPLTPSAPSPSASHDDLDFNLDFDMQKPSGNATPAPQETLSMDAPIEMSAPAEPAKSEPEGIDFDFNSLMIEAASPATDAPQETPSFEATPDFGVSFESENETKDEPKFEAVPPELADAQGDDGLGSAEFDSQIDETATKLDLAKAYIDMGDADGARSILDEVLAEGNDLQKKQAAELARQIAA